MLIERRSFLKGLGATLFVAPAIVRAESLMQVREVMPSVPDWCPPGWLPLDGREIKKKFYPDLYRSYERMRFPMFVANEQRFEGYGGYKIPDGRLQPSFVRIIAAKDQVRSNGTIARAGVVATISIPTEH
jgi:hypothetical protein